jgi:small subunit ribosomal protein S20
MPIIKSAKKRVKVASKARARNVRTKRSLREALKAFNKAVEGGKAADIQKAQQTVVSAIDIAAKKNVIHKNKAARQKAALSAQAKAAGAKPVKAAAKKPAVSKKTAKPAVTTVAKKSVAKKPAAKKPASKK